MLSLGLVIVLVAPPGQSTAAMQQIVGSPHKLDANLRLGGGGYNRRVAPRRPPLQRSLYNVSPSGELRYDYYNAFRRERRYNVRQSTAHFDNHLRYERRPYGTSRRRPR
ncbi:MAG: hypothetical protein ACYS0G_05250 [Planctomycetota bacterium]|jgi:hypothetical protein